MIDNKYLTALPKRYTLDQRKVVKGRS